MAWGKNGTPDTLTVAGDILKIADLTAKKFNVFLGSEIATGNIDNPRWTFNNNTNTVYATRECTNGGSEFTSTNAAGMNINLGNAAWDRFIVVYSVSISSEEKLSIIHNVASQTAGAGTAPARLEQVGKFVPSPDADITRVDVTNTGSGSFDISSNISALGFDITPAAAIPFPANVQVGSRAEITDTRKMYHYESGLKYEDDFSTDNWTDNDSTYIGVSGGSMNWNCKRDGSNDASVYDLTSTSANWVLRFKLTVTNVSSTTGAGNGFYVGLSDSIQTAGQSTSQDFIGVSIYNDNTDTYRTIDADGSALPHIYQGDSNQSTTYNTGSVWYYEIIKTGSSYTVEAFSGSDYSTGSEGKITGSSPASGLRYLKVLNDMESIPTSTNPFQGTIDDLKFYNGVTSSTGNAWKEEGT